MLIDTDDEIKGVSEFICPAFWMHSFQTISFAPIDRKFVLEL